VKVPSLALQLTYIIILTIKLQYHAKAKTFITKPFPLYDDLMDLCHSVIATGSGDFRDTCGLEYGSSEQADESEEDQGGREDMGSEGEWMDEDTEGLSLLMGGARE